MEQQSNIRKKKEKDIDREKDKDNIPFMQVDKGSDPISNFIANLKRQFNNAKGLGLERLFGRKPAEQQKQPAAPESIIGATKTDMRSDFKNTDNSLTEKTGKKPALRMGNAIKPQQARQNNKKPKLGL